MNALKYIQNKFQLEGNGNPYEIPDCNREDLPLLFKELGYKIGAEIGVESGLFSLCLVKTGLQLYCIDSWKAYRGYRDHVTQSKLDKFYRTVKKRLKPYGSILVRKFSMDAVKDFKDNALDFVYIDANHTFDYVVRDIIEWSKKVKKGGIVAGHDYIRTIECSGVIGAVKGYTKGHKIRPWFVVGREIKNEGLKRDDARSWFWVK